jgi:hypothetical protein
MGSETVIKRDELLAALREPEGDSEAQHHHADCLLEDYLRESGDLELAKALATARNDQNWWYA